MWGITQPSKEGNPAIGDINEPEGHRLSKIAQIKTDMCDLTNVWSLKNVKLMETEGRSMLVRAGGWGKGRC